MTRAFSSQVSRKDGEDSTTTHSTLSTLTAPSQHPHSTLIAPTQHTHIYRDYKVFRGGTTSQAQGAETGFGLEKRVSHCFCDAQGGCTHANVTGDWVADVAIATPPTARQQARAETQFILLHSHLFSLTRCAFQGQKQLLLHSSLPCWWRSEHRGEHRTCLRSPPW
jgi:hypothetical protein